MLTINTNVNNLILQRNLNTVNFAMKNAMERLTTGYRINTAADDAAGLVISKALEVQSRGLNVASQNAQMATNVLGVADGALGKMGDLTMRIRDLALQAANGGYGDAERRALEAEAKELTANLRQLEEGTKFNEFNIFACTQKRNNSRKRRACGLYDNQNRRRP